MPNAKLPIDWLLWPAGKIALSSAVLLLAFSMAGCGGSVAGSQTGTSTAATPGPQTYFAPIVAGTTYSTPTSPSSAVALTNPLTYTLDDTALTFSQTTYQAIQGNPGPQVLNAGCLTIDNPGCLTIDQRGLRSLGITANYVSNGNANAAYNVTTHNPPEPGSFAVELANQAGGLIQLVGQPAAPMTPATACPNSSQTYLFLTIPGGLTSQSGSQHGWDPATDTAYGLVQISSNGSTVTFQNPAAGEQVMDQHTLSGTGPAQPSASPVSGTCASTFYGYTTVVPGQLVIGNPGIGGGQQIPPQATLAIGPTGLLVEDNGSNATNPLPNTSPALLYNNFLGAGTGAIGLPQPSSALSTSAVVGAQYLGFIYGAGVYVRQPPYTQGSSSHVASFGFATQPSTCSTFAAQIAAQGGTLANPIYGGDYLNDNPSASTSGFGNCDFAIDLGTTQSPAGVYPNVTVWMGANYAANPQSPPITYSFSAVAIAGQLNGKYAIFVLGVDSKESNQPWVIYLMQSN